MQELESVQFEERQLPEQIDYYRISPDGTVVECNAMSAPVYISEYDVQFFSDKDMMLYIRHTYGAVIGVMHDVTCQVQPTEYRTPKVLLGVVKH